MLSQDKEACLPCCQKHILPLICRAKQQQGPLSPLETCICLFFFQCWGRTPPPAHPATGLGWAYPEAGEPSTKGTVHCIPVRLQSACHR